MKPSLTFFLIRVIFFLCIATVTSYAQTVGDWPMEFITWDIKDCPSSPQYDFWERNCLIKTAEPSGEIQIPQGGVDGLNLESPMWISIPTNRPTWAIGIAHAWNLHRNFIQKYDFPKIGYYMAITGHETGMACDCDADFTDGHMPWSTTGQGELNWPAKCGDGARADDGCFQMEFYNAWGELNQIFPDRFPCSKYEDVISGSVFETQVLALSYRNIGYSLLMEYSWNMNPWEIFENPNCDEYAYEKFLAASWNGSISGTYKTLTQSNVFSLGGWEPDTTKQKANPVHFFENRVATANNANWDLDGTVAYYPEVIAWSLAAIEGNTSYPGYRYDAGDYTGALISTGTGQAGELDYLGNPLAAGEKLSLNSVNGTYPELQDHVSFGYYNEDILWSDVDLYIDRMLPFYFEFEDPILLAQVKENVKAVFVEISGSELNPIPFKQLGPVVDEIILSFPKEDPLVAMLQLDGLPNGPGGNGHSTCTGNYAPASHIRPVNIQTDTMCTDQTLILEADVVGGDEPNMEYTWYLDGNIVATGINVSEYAFTPTAPGIHEFELLICNQAGGCAMSACTYIIEVKACSACNLVATITTINTPCRNSEGGQLILDVVGSSDYTVTYDGPTSGSQTGTASQLVIDNLLDGIYNITITDNVDLNCFYLTSEEVGYDFYMNDVVEATVEEIRDCEADLKATIVKDDCQCDYTVYARSLVANRWERYITMKITPSNGRFEIFRGNTFGNAPEPLFRKFQLCSGESIKGEMHIIAASGSCDTNRVDAVNHQLESYEVWVENPEGTEVFRQTYGPGSVIQEEDLLLFDITIACPYASPFDYSFVWTPSGKTDTLITEQNGNSEEVMYHVVATNIQHPQCVIRDSVLVPFECSTGCTSPGEVTLSPQGPLEVCDGDQLLTVTTSKTAPVSGFEYEFFYDDGNSVVSVSGPSIINSFNATVTGKYHVVVYDPLNPAICFGESNHVDIEIFTLPSEADAGLGGTVCSNEFSLDAVSPLVGQGLWTMVSGPGSFVDPVDPKTSINGLAVGDNTLRWTVSNGACIDSQDEIIIHVDELPSMVSAGENQVVCFEEASLNAQVPEVGLGSWTLMSGSGGISDVNDPAAIVVGLGVGDNVFEWTISNGVCPSTSSQVTVSRDENPSKAITGEDLSICENSSTLNALPIVVGEGQWTVVTGSGVVQDISDPTSSVTGLGVGINTFKWTVSNGECAANEDEVTITVNESVSETDAGDDQILCSDEATLEANAPQAGTGEWILVSGSGIIEELNNPTSAVAGLAIGDNVFEWTVSSNDCPSASSQVTISRDENPSAANAGENQYVCSEIAQLNAATVAVGQGVWSLVSGSVLIDDELDPFTNLSGVEIGTNTLKWEVKNGVCPPSSDEVDIVRTESAAADVLISPISPAPVCENESITFYATPINGGSSPVYEWFLNGQSQGSAAIRDSFVVSAPDQDDVVYVKMISDLDCATGSPVSSIESIINIDFLPDVSSAGADELICSNQYDLLANTPITGIGEWRVISGSGNFENTLDPITSVSDLNIGENTFEWEVSSGVCPSQTSQVTITRVQDMSAPDAGDDQRLCITDQSSILMNANFPANGEQGTWTVINGSGVFDNDNDPKTTVSGLSVGSNEFSWSLSNSVCPTVGDLVSIVIDESPTEAQAGSDQVICDAVAQLTANDVVSGSGVWSVLSGQADISNVNDPMASIILHSDEAVFVWTIVSGNACGESADEVSITSIGTVPVGVELIATSQTVCVGEVSGLSVVITNSGTNPQYSWEVNGDLVSTDNDKLELNNLTEDVDVQVTVTSSLPCAFPSQATDGLTINVIDPPVPEIVGGDVELCENESEIMEVHGEGNVSWFKNDEFQFGGNVIELNNQSAGQWYASLNNGVCAPVNSSPIHVQVFQQPTVDAGQDVTVKLGESVQLNGSSDVGYSTWSPATNINDVNSHNPIFSSTNSSEIEFVYTLAVSNGPCDAVDQVVVNVELPVLIPNAFTPNGDGEHDTWQIQGLDRFEEIHVVIFNRWGAIVSERYDRQNWDGLLNGKPLPTATYYYLLELDDNVFEGTVSLVH